ncbi:MAG TPA: hypothetical protein VL180_04450, partial [Burkholderiales bacterium]|nr:hypothetical protein [Burkholderiales bacterium]
VSEFAIAGVPNAIAAAAAGSSTSLRSFILIPLDARNHEIAYPAMLGLVSRCSMFFVKTLRPA